MWGGPPFRIDENTLAPNHSFNAVAHWEWDLNPRYHWREPLFGWIFWRDNNVPLRAYEIDSSLAPYWFTAMEAGRLNWNNSAAPVNFNANQSTNNRVRAGDFDLDVAGNIYYYRWPIIGDRFTLRLDFVRIYHNADVWDVPDELYIESVMAHELGHAVGLEDCFGNSFGGGPNGSIMNQNRSRADVRGPTDFDINNVRRIYD